MTLPLDVMIQGRRVNVRSGTKDAKVVKALREMVRILPRLGYLELVWDIDARRRKPLEVYNHYVNGTLDHLSGPSTDQPILALLDSWLTSLPVVPETRARYEQCRDQLGLSERDQVRDIGHLLAAYRGECEGKPRTFNLTRSMLQGFLRDQLGRQHRLYLEVSGIVPRRERKDGRRGLPLDEAIKLRDRLSPKAARIWWSMCITGMGPKELWGRWEVLADRVKIFGTKREGRVREVPLIDYPVRPELTRWGFTSALRRYGYAPYQGRKTYAVWLDAAGIPNGRQDMYMGHGPLTMRQLYNQPEIVGYLKGDAQTMRGMLGPTVIALVKP